MKQDKVHLQVQNAVEKYHLYMFQLDHQSTFQNIASNQIEQMTKYVRMFDDLIEIIKNVYGIDYIDTYLNNHKDFQQYSSVSNYYYKRKKIENILWKYLFGILI